MRILLQVDGLWLKQKSSLKWMPTSITHNTIPTMTITLNSQTRCPLRQTAISIRSQPHPIRTTTCIKDLTQATWSNDLIRLPLLQREQYVEFCLRVAQIWSLPHLSRLLVWTKSTSKGWIIERWAQLTMDQQLSHRVTIHNSISRRDSHSIQSQSHQAQITEWEGMPLTSTTAQWIVWEE